MSSDSNFKSVFVFNWTVERPLCERSKISPPFHMSGMNLYFLFNNTLEEYLDDEYVAEHVYNLYTLHLRSTKNKNVPLDFLNGLEVTVNVKDIHKMYVSQLASQFTEVIHEIPARIWARSENEVLNHIQNFHSNGIVTFVITVTRPVRKCKDESIQTSPCIYNLPCLEKLSEDFSKLLAGGSSQPDVMLVCGDQTAHVHSQILNSRSDVLAATLSNDMAESRTGRIEIRDMDPEIFKIFLRYLYTGVLPEFTTETAKCLYEAGDRHAVHGLVKRCSRYLEENLSEENVCEILVLADAHSDQAFKEVALNYILEKEIHLNHKDWDDFYKRHESLGNEVHFRFCKKVRKF